MSKTVSGLNYVIRKGEKLGWIMLILSALLFPWSGKEPPLEGIQGKGMVALDMVITVSLWGAAISQFVDATTNDRKKTTLERLSEWLMLFALCILCGRLTWLIVVFGDATIAPSMAAALLSICGSVIIRAVCNSVYTLEDKHG